MSNHRPPGQGRAAQLRALSRYVREHVYPYSTFYRARLDQAGLRRDASGADVLRSLAPIALADIDDPSTVMLRPDERSIQRYGRTSLLLQVFWAKATARPDRVNRVLIEPEYKPVHWHVDAGIPIAYSHADVDRLGELGRQWLVHAGLSRYDVVVGLLPPGPYLAYWELVLGCRRAGLSSLHLTPPVTAAQLEAAQPTVVAGRPADIVRVLSAVRRDGRRLPRLHTVLAAGEPIDEHQRDELRALAPNRDTTVVGAWSPPGVRSLWVECVGGEAYHTFPDAEIVEVVDPLTQGPVRPGADGELVWTAIDWRGTALLRLRTGVYGAVDESPCLVCGRTSPRVRLAPREPAFVRVLDRARGLAGWQAELRTVGGAEELIVYVAVEGNGHPGPLLRDLDRELTVTQFVVVPKATLAARLAAAGDKRVIDLRDGASAPPL